MTDTQQTQIGAEDGRIEGVVKWFADERSYGFILGTDGIDYFCHLTGIRPTGTGLRGLTEGQRVTFKLKQGPRGMIADDVVPEADGNDG